MGAFLVVQAAGRVMQKQKNGGSIVMMTSMSGSATNKVAWALFPLVGLLTKTREQTLWHTIPPRQL
jgi:hypothetical protein